MTDRKTGRVPPLSDWKGWIALATLIITPPSISTAVLTVKLDSLQSTVAENTEASDENTLAVNGIKLEMAARLVTDTRLSAVEKKSDEYEQRIRVLEGR